ncbi:MAG: hypothetical protein JWM47_4544 [Acidimicrobiales bacterium]|nr:hypothetical protein [Acidimicrobiales bacterium]
MSGADVLIETALDADVIARQVVHQKRLLKKAFPPQADLATAITGIDVADTIKGSSTLTITIADQDWKLLDAGFFDADRNGKLDPIDLNYPDGSRLWWRLMQCNPSGPANPTITLVFMERAAVYLMRHHGPVKAKRGKNTRAEFLKSLVDIVKADGGVRFHSKELHKSQPIAGGAVTGLPRSAIGHVFIEGDSLAVGSDPVVKQRLGSGWTVTTDAAIGRHVSEGRDAIVANGSLPEVVVVELGTNDYGISDATWRGYIDDICNHCGPSRHVVWVNLKSSAVSFASMNASLAAKAVTHSNLAILDWAGLVDSEGITLDASVHVHPDSAGYRKRAKLIADALKDPKNIDGGTAQKTPAERRAAKDKGLTSESIKGIKVNGAQLTEEQRRTLEIALTVAENLNAGDHATKAMLCSGFGESGWRDIMEGNFVPVAKWLANPSGPWAYTNGYGGPLQGQVAKHGSNWFGPMTAAKRTEEQAKSFLKGGRGYQGGGAIYLAKAHRDWTPGRIAVTVEGSGVDPAHYDQYSDLAAQVIAAWGGASAGTGAQTYRKKFNFTVGRHENFWNAAVRLAEEVNWPFFVDGNDVYYDAETTLIKQQPVAVIHRGDAQVIDFDVTWDERHIATEATLELVCDPFEFRAGEVLTLIGFGPASTGSTAKPPLPGRWLIESSDRDRYKPSTTFTLKQPSRPKREPAAEVATKNTDYSDTDVTVDKGMTPKDIIDKIVLPIGRRHALKTSQGLDLTPKNVEKANETHGPVTNGNHSDHQGPSNERWAADMSNGLMTAQERACAKELADRFNIPWEGKGIASATHDGFRYQLIWGVDLGVAGGGDHTNHVHFGVAKTIYTGAALTYGGHG